MTRINAGIDVMELSDKHLLAEHREIKRVPNAISSGRYNMDGIPDRFTLGKGHVKFFYDKMLYLRHRYDEIHRECVRRGFNVQYYGSAWDRVPARLMNDYKPTPECVTIVRGRILERSRNMNRTTR